MEKGLKAIDWEFDEETKELLEDIAIKNPWGVIASIIKSF